MSDEKKPRGNEIQVRRMRFACPMDVPGKSVTEGLEAFPVDPKRPNIARHEIVFLPHLRHHLITFHSPERQPESAYVHERHVLTWVPA